MTTAFGDLARFAQLPPATLSALAKADPAKLAEFASALPKDVTEATTAMADVKAEVAKLAKAAAAAQKVTSPVSADDTVAYATVTFDRTTLSASQADSVVRILEKANTPELTVGGSGTMLDSAGTGPDTSQAIGLLVAIVILLLAFGSLIAAGLPIVVAVTGLVAGQLLVLVVARFTDVASFAPTLAAMIGLGVGIDYALFIMNRFTQGVRSGQEPKDAALTAVGTAGKAVAFAGSTVIVALLGMFVLRIDFFNGLALAAATAVLMVMLSALWMLPALLSLLGNHALGVRMPWARHPKPFDPTTSRWNAYGRLLQRMPIVPAVLSLLLVGVLALPAASITMGFPDDSSAAPGSPQRIGFDLLAKGFGAGVNGPFFIAVETPKKDDYAALEKTITALEATPGVAQTIPSSGMLPILRLDKSVFGSGGTVTSMIVQPTTAPSDEATGAVLDTIRTTTAPQVLDETGTRIYVGGTQAVSEDFTTELTAALPVFLLLVVGLGFIALMLLFHSLLIPLTAARHLAAELRGRPRGHRGGVPEGHRRLTAGRDGHRPDPALPADHGVRHPVRPVDGLPGVPRLAHARGVGVLEGQLPGRPAGPRRLRPRRRAGRDDHDERLPLLRPDSRRHHQALRRRARVGRADRRLHRPPRARAVADEPVRPGQLVDATMARTHPADHPPGVAACDASVAIAARRPPRGGRRSRVRRLRRRRPPTSGARPSASSAHRHRRRSTDRLCRARPRVADVAADAQRHRLAHVAVGSGAARSPVA